MLCYAFRLLNGWQNNFSGCSVHTESNDRVALTTVSDEKEDFKKTSKKKDMTSFRCKNIGHHSIK